MEDTRVINFFMWKEFTSLRLLEANGPIKKATEHATDTVSNLERRRRISAWVAREIIGHEGAVRAWLRRNRVLEEDAEELIQDAYCRLAMLDAVDHIARPDAYFFSIVRNLLLRRLRRAKVVTIEAVAEIEAYVDDGPSLERQVAGRQDYGHILRLIDRLPERCRKVVRLRKIEGWSQKEIAAHLGMSEKAVEKQVWLGIRAIQRAWSEIDEQFDLRLHAIENEGGRM